MHQIQNIKTEKKNKKKTKKKQRFDSGYFLDKIDFEDDGT